MPLTIGTAFTIPGYTTTTPPDYDTEPDAVVYAADAVVDHPAFWSQYLLIVSVRLSSASFAVTPAENEAMCAVLYDPERWPVVSVPLDGDAWLRIVYRNFEGDAGIDFVTERPGRPAKVFDLILDGGTSPMTWDDLLAAAKLPDDRLTWPQRFILMLPLLETQELPADAVDVMSQALDGIGATDARELAAAIINGRYRLASIE